VKSRRSVATARPTLPQISDELSCTVRVSMTTCGWAGVGTNQPWAIGSPRRRNRDAHRQLFTSLSPLRGSVNGRVAVFPTRSTKLRIAAATAGAASELAARRASH